MKVILLCENMVYVRFDCLRSISPLKITPKIRSDDPEVVFYHEQHSTYQLRGKIF